MDLNDITEFLLAAARSVGAEVTSPWFYLQVGLILASAGIAFAVGAAVRSKVDVTSLAMRWPATPAPASCGSMTSGPPIWWGRWRWP